MKNMLVANSNFQSELIAQRMRLIKPSATLAVTTRAAALKASGRDIIGLGAGEPDFDTPENIKTKAIAAINAGKTKYTAVDGIPELKKAICEKFKRENNLEYTPEQITVGTGGKQVLFNIIFSIIDPGNEVIIPAPYWVSYTEIVSFAEGVPVIIRCAADDEFKLRPEVLEAAITPNTKCIILNSPSNPTGATYTKEELKALAVVLLKYPQIQIIVDDIYEHIVYDDMKFYTLAEVEPLLKSRVFIVNGMSKGYAMTGWRIGYGAGDASLIQAISIVQSQSTSNPCSISQYAALEGLTGPQDHIAKNRRLFQNRRDLTVKAINDIPGLQCFTPQGAFYVFPSCHELFGKQTPKGDIIKNSTEFTEYLLEEASVAVVQGEAFGLEGFFRISYATSEEKLLEACNRIKKACAVLR